ncbi:hypothetical protein [Flindersiella endophytica]
MSPHPASSRLAWQALSTNDEPQEEQTWSIGALARAAGVSGRTLRYDDQIGLPGHLRPVHG